MRLPSGYQEVEYIQSTATNPGSDTSSGQYIDTLVTINKNIKVDIDMQFTSLALQSRLFGGLYDSGSSGITFGPYINGSTQWARATANGVGNWQSTSVAANTNRNRFVLDNTRYIIYNSSGTQVYNGTNSSTISNSDTWTIPLLASKDRSLNRVSRHSSAKLYGCKIWDNNVLVRDFVPCYRKSDNETGLYDLVNNQFYSNSGTGSFIKGPRILPDWKIKKIYLGTDLVRPVVKEYTYSFIDKSVATLQADGWEFWRNSGTATSGWQFTSNGLHNTETSESTKRASIGVNHGLNLSNAKKITITVNHYLVSGSWNGASSYQIRDGMNSSGAFAVGGDIYSMNNSGYNGYSVFCTDSTSVWNRTKLSTGNYVGQTVIDLVNKTVVAKLTGKSDLSLSLSDAQITSIRGCQYLRIYYDNVGNYYKDINIKRE